MSDRCFSVWQSAIGSRQSAVQVVYSIIFPTKLNRVARKAVRRKDYLPPCRLTGYKLSQASDWARKLSLLLSEMKI